jgi:protein-S-isoprenylcysteine O-methyltransferase Ste14
VMSLLLFVPAGTVHYWQAWVYLSIFMGASALTTLYLIRRDPALLQRRMSGGPMAEKQPAQKFIMLCASIGFIALPPLALGSYWALIPGAAMIPFLVWRLLDEERFLAANLSGYIEYQKRVRHRLVPFVW